MATQNPFSAFPNGPARTGDFRDYTDPGELDGKRILAIGSGTIEVLSTVNGGVARLSARATTDDSGINMQNDASSIGLVVGKNYRYISRFRFSESTSANVAVQSDFLLGLASVDDSAIASAPAHGFYFLKTDGAATLDVMARAASVTVLSSLGVATLAKDTWYVFAIDIAMDPTTSGRATVTFSIDGATVFSGTVSGLSMEATILYRTTCAFQSGDATGTKWFDLDYDGFEVQR